MEQELFTWDKKTDLNGFDGRVWYNQNLRPDP